MEKVNARRLQSGGRDQCFYSRLNNVCSRALSLPPISSPASSPIYTGLPSSCSSYSWLLLRHCGSSIVSLAAAASLQVPLPASRPRCPIVHLHLYFCPGMSGASGKDYKISASPHISLYEKSLPLHVMICSPCFPDLCFS